MKKTLMFIVLAMLAFFPACERNQSIIDDLIPGSTTARTTFVLTDAPRDELSLLQVELTELKIKNEAETETVIFTEAEGETFVFNLLDLQDMSALLGSIPLEPGNYKEMSLSYQNATALDSDGNVLTVREQHYGTAKVVFNPLLVVTEEENFFVEIDFDLNNSVYNIVSGPKGHLLLSPTLIVKVKNENEGEEITEVEGTVQSMEEMSLVIDLNGESITIALTENTVIEVGELTVTPGSVSPFDLGAYFSVGDDVEVRGIFDVETNIVTATKIERKLPDGLEVGGIIVGLGSSSFDVLVLDPEDSGFEPGSTPTFTYDDTASFFYCDPYKAAAADQLALGQAVEVIGDLTDPSVAQQVKLKLTKLEGTINTYDAANQQILVDVTKVKGVAVDNIPGFVNPVVVEFAGEFPAEPARKSDDDGEDDDDDDDDDDGEEENDDTGIKVKGHFNYETDGIFTAFEYDVDEEGDDEEDGEETDENTWVGKIFSVLSTSPLQIEIRRGNRGKQAVTVNVGTETTIVEKDKSVTTTIAGDALAAGINSGRYKKLKAKGTYDAAAGTLDASLIVATIKD